MDFFSRLKAILSIRDLDPTAIGDETTLIASLQPFEPDDLAQTLAKLNLLYFSDEVRKNPDLRDDLLANYFIPADYARIRRFIRSGFRPVMHRLIVPGILERLFRIDPSQFGSLKISTEPQRVGRLLLTANLVFYPDEEFHGNEDAVIAHYSAEFFRDSFLSHDDDFGSSFARYWAMFTEGQEAASQHHPTERVALEELCLELFGISIQDVFTLGQGLLARYLRPVQQLIDGGPGEFLIGPRYFRTQANGEELQSKGARLLERLGRTWEEHRKKVADDVQAIPSARFHAFGMYDTPLLKVSPETWYRQASAHGGITVGVARCP